MRVILTTSAVAVVLLVLSLIFAIAGNADVADGCWQGAVLVVIAGAIGFALRFVPEGPIGADRIAGTLFDEPDSFWGRWNRFYRG